MKLLSKSEILKNKIKYNPICGVYFLISKRQIIYVGISENILSRINVHKKKKIPFDSFYYHQFNKKDYDKMMEAESDYIFNYLSKYNNKIEHKKYKLIKILKNRYINSKVDTRAVIIKNKVYVRVD